MCGIAGFIDFKRNSSESILSEMTDSMAHRGPDGSGLYFSENPDFQIGFGHRRLSIIELSELGKQPMFFNELSIVFNGEIYNHAEIRGELVKSGHTFVSHSDTEVILHAYKEWGEKCLDKFIGMFAFAIFDATKKELFLARDRAGVKPMFLYKHNGLFMFASELKAFHKHPDFKKALNISAVQAFLHYGNVPSDACIFEHCLKLNPGHYILSSVQESGLELKQQQYWNVYDFYNKPKLSLGIEELKNETEKLLKSACEYRMVSDVPVGIFLSGGYDSACVTALLQKDRTEQLKTFTVSVPDIGLNEAPYAKQTADFLGTDHTEIACSAEEVIALLGDLSLYYDEPFADSSALPTTLVSLMAKKEVTVALSADGGDEVFAGYNRYEMILNYGAKINRIPAFARRGFAGFMEIVPADIIPYFRNKYNFAQRYEKTKSILRNSSSKNIMLSLSQLFTEEQVKKLSIQEYNKLKTAYDSTELLHSTPLSYMQAIDYETYLPDDILQKVDRASMSASLESREPLLDHRLIEWAARIPDEFKIRNNEKKWLLKEIVHRYVPREMLDRQKMGFAIPIESWLKNELRDQVDAVLCKEEIESAGLFQWNEIEKIRNKFFSGKKEYGVKIWYLFTFQLWYNRWMKTNSKGKSEK